MIETGIILVAHPKLPKTNPFQKTVIYVYESNSTGIMGLVVNKPTSYTIKELCQGKGLDYPESVSTLHQGGPVNQTALVLLHTDEWYSDNTAQAGQGLCVSSDNKMLEKLAHGEVPLYWRMFSGMSAWTKDQLQMELRGQFPYRPENSWLTAQANDDILFEYDGEEQWEQAIALSSSQMINQFF